MQAHVGPTTPSASSCVRGSRLGLARPCLPRRAPACTRAVHTAAVDPSDEATASTAGSSHAPLPALSRRTLLAAVPVFTAAASSVVLPMHAAHAEAAPSGFPRLPTPEEQAAIDKATNTVISKQKCPVALRLMYHDAGSYSASSGDGGANASIQFELERPENFGLKRGWHLVEALRAALKGSAAEGVVSDADLIALAGAAAVRITGGPAIPVRIGRATASGPDPDNRMPGMDASAEQLKANFADKGFSLKEFVVLCGAHTLGNKGFGDAYTFDTAYYTALLNKPWTNTKDPMSSHIGLPTDHVLPDDPQLLPFIQEYASDQARFFADFSDAYVRLSELGVSWRA